MTGSSQRTGSWDDQLNSNNQIIFGIAKKFWTNFTSFAVLTRMTRFTIFTRLWKCSTTGGGGAGEAAWPNWIHIQRPCLFPHLSRPAKAAHKNSWPCPAYDGLCWYPALVYLVCTRLSAEPTISRTGPWIFVSSLSSSLSRPTEMGKQARSLNMNSIWSCSSSCYSSCCWAFSPPCGNC